MPDHSDLPDVPQATGGVSTVSIDDVTEAMKDVVDPVSYTHLTLPTNREV